MHLASVDAHLPDEFGRIQLDAAIVLLDRDEQ
jgi:hypothetical protein